MSQGTAQPFWGARPSRITSWDGSRRRQVCLIPGPIARNSYTSHPRLPGPHAAGPEIRAKRKNRLQLRPKSALLYCNLSAEQILRNHLTTCLPQPTLSAKIDLLKINWQISDRLPGYQLSRQRSQPAGLRAQDWTSCRVSDTSLISLRLGRGRYFYACHECCRVLSSARKEFAPFRGAGSTARQQLAAEGDPKNVARKLLADGRLTKWQARQLLHGRHALMIGPYKLLDQAAGDNVTSRVPRPARPIGAKGRTAVVVAKPRGGTSGRGPGICRGGGEVVRRREPEARGGPSSGRPGRHVLCRVGRACRRRVGSRGGCVFRFGPRG